MRYSTGRADVAWNGEARDLQDAFDQMRSAGTSFQKLDLSNHDLSGLALRDVDLSGSRFRSTRCQETDFSGNDLSGTHFISADLNGAVLDRCDLTGTYFTESDLNRASLRGVQGVPALPDLHAQVYLAASRDGGLCTDRVHDGDHTHSRAGWVTHLAGMRAYEYLHRPEVLAHLVYLASDPERFSGPEGEDLPDFSAGRDETLRDLARLAGVGA